VVGRVDAPSKPARESLGSWIRAVALAPCFLMSFGAGFGYASWTLVCRAGRCPSLDVLDEYQPRQTSRVYAADGRLIAELGLERRTIVKLGQIPPRVRAAFVVTEDKRFWTHHGIDYRRIPGAVLGDIRRRRWSQGFSTITMQLARNIFPERISREKSLTRKLKEARVARAIHADRRRHDEHPGGDELSIGGHRHRVLRSRTGSHDAVRRQLPVRRAGGLDGKTATRKSALAVGPVVG
jgi:membrane peptidoglycan carboxypeptidase